MYNLYNFKVGDLVVIHVFHGVQTTSIAKIDKVFKKYVVLTNGTKWNFYGNQYGGKTSWGFYSRIEPVTEEEVIKFREKQALKNKQNKIIGHINNEWGNKEVSPELINSVYSILFLEKK